MATVRIDSLIIVLSVSESKSLQFTIREHPDVAHRFSFLCFCGLFVFVLCAHCCQCLWNSNIFHDVVNGCPPFPPALSFVHYEIPQVVRTELSYDLYATFMGKYKFCCNVITHILIKKIVTVLFCRANGKRRNIRLEYSGNRHHYVHREICYHTQTQGA